MRGAIGGIVLNLGLVLIALKRGDVVSAMQNGACVLALAAYVAIDRAAARPPGATP